MSDKRILFQGDSITDGLRFKLPEQAWDLNHQMGHSFPYVVNAVLGSRYPQNGLQFINRGISGNGVVDLYARMNQDILALRPDYINFLVGINDTPEPGQSSIGITPDKYEKVYRMMLEEISEKFPETHFILCEPFALAGEKDRERILFKRRHVEQLALRAKNIAMDLGCTWVSLQQMFDDAAKLREPEYWVWDGIHPTENGHGLIARQWMAAVGAEITGDSDFVGI